MYHKFYSLFFIIIFSSFIGYGQSFSEPDSLKNKSYEELKDGFFKYLDSNKVKAKIYIDTYLSKAKGLKDSSRIGKSYHIKTWLYDFSDIRKIKTLDSAIQYSKSIHSKHYPEVLYNQRALAYGDQGNLENQLRDYLTALEYSKKNKNEPYINLLKNNIAVLKIDLTKYEEAKVLLKECLIYKEKEMINKGGKWDSIHYFYSLVNQIRAYRSNNQLDSARILNNKGLKLISQKSYAGVSIFDLNDGVFDYYNREYHLAEKKIIKVLNTKYDYDNSDLEKLIYGYFYLGKVYTKLDQKRKSIFYFKKIDSINDRGLNSISREVRLTYVELVDYFKSKNDYPNQLFYLNKLLKIDSILSSNYKIVGDKLLKEFDTKELVEEKQRIIAKLKKEKADISTTNIIISTFLALSLLGLGYYYYRQDLYRKRFIALLKKTEQTNQKNRDLNSTEVESTSINKEVVNSLLDQLEKFEAEQQYLASNLNIKDLAKRFGSNSSYLSKVVNTFKEKSFSNYINDLRINYAVQRLKEDAVFRKYTVKAIGQEIGFKNPDAFSKAFYKQTGIHPSYFIKEIEKKIDNESIASVEAKS